MKKLLHRGWFAGINAALKIGAKNLILKRSKAFHSIL
jgi:hypothetical protein